ncbi:MAG TPA: peptidoglycan-binding protein, partial [Solirubrobacteraceae bacterium]|nr:peptidoglycan-binding protein [Solirubrobacteraceae bacterium]
ASVAPEAPPPSQGRRTVQIRGRLDDPPRPGARRHRVPHRAPVTVGDRLGARPDRVAGWAFAFCLLVILIAATTAGAATTLGERTLKRGMEGRDVRHLQLRLDRLGFYDGPANARFGASTQRAVSAYQRSRCLDADGVAGPATVRALRANRRACRGSQRSTSGRRPYVRTALGTRTLRRGDRGRDVRVLQRLIGMRSSGDFGPRTLRAVRRFQREAGLQGDGLVGPTTRGALAQRRMAVRGASWYGPGLYGNRTACGQALTTSLQGVAHRAQPCGTRVTLAHRGRFVTVPVVDRGPYVDGLTFDLTHATARTLGFSGTQALRARY